MRGGSRWGSGRPAHKVQLSNRISIDIRRWHREGYLKRQMYSFGWEWRTDGEKTNSINAQIIDANTIRLNYRTKGYYDTEWQPRETTLHVTYTPCNYGGTRPWFVCPRTGRKAAKLYFVNGYWVSRYAFKHGYVSQSCTPIDLAHRRKAKVEAILGEDLERPKGMHHRTYENLCANWQAVDDWLMVGALQIWDRWNTRLFS